MKNENRRESLLFWYEFELLFNGNSIKEMGNILFYLQKLSTFLIKAFKVPNVQKDFRFSIILKYTR